MPSKKINPELPAEEVQTTAPPAKASTTRGTAVDSGADDLLTISDQERGIMPEDSDDVKWNYMSGAARRKLVLTGIVSGLESMDSDSPICVVDYEGIRVLIPGRQMFLDDWPEDDKIPLDHRMRLGRMLGATIDFISSICCHRYQ